VLLDSLDESLLSLDDDDDELDLETCDERSEDECDAFALLLFPAQPLRIASNNPAAIANLNFRFFIDVPPDRFKNVQL